MKYNLEKTLAWVEENSLHEDFTWNPGWVMRKKNPPPEVVAEYAIYHQQFVNDYHQRLADMHADDNLTNNILKTFVFGKLPEPTN